MADGADLVTLKLTFWHKDKKPGDLVQVRRDELHRWRGFGVPVESDAQQAEQAKTDTAADSTPKAPAKTSSTGKQA